MRLRIALVIAIAVLAGCSSFGTSGTTSTVTPAPVPAANETADENPLPPGVSGNGIPDPARLALAHSRTLNGTAYTWHEQRLTVQRIDNETYRTERRQIAHVENETTYDYWTYDYWTNRRPDRGDDPFSFVEQYTEYTNSEVRYARFVDNGELLYRQYPTRPARSRIAGLANGEIRRYLSVENATVAVALVDGERYYTINGTDYALPSRWTISNYTVNATVSPDGFVRTMNVSYVRARGQEREVIEYGFVYTRIGETTVEQPDWVQQRWGGERRSETDANVTATP